MKLKHFNINSAKVAFKDDSLQSSTTSNIDKINMNAYNIDSKENSWLKYDMSLRVNKKGVVSSKGSVRHTPLKQKGTFSLNRISLKEITPYLGESLFVQIDDGYLSLDSKLEYEKNDKKADLFVNGGLKIEEFKLADSRSNTPLITFAKTELKSFNFEMFPNSLYIDAIELDNFYVDAQIDEKKQMNFAKLSKFKSDDNLTKAEDANTSKVAKEENFPMKIMRLHVSNSKVNFADYSLPIRFKTSIHDLNGDVYVISTKKGEVSYIDIDGEVDEYGSTKLKGSIEISDIKSFTDIGFSFKNLSLDSYSGYSAQFAGYKIDKGKLFLDLDYKILDSELLGENTLIIKSIELGDEVEDENITKLPLGFAIALLEDSDGVIDIDMPVEGNLDAPDFKYGELVLKTFAKLILKAVASPFNFLGAAMGLKGDDLKYVEFEASENVILPAEKEKLDNIAKILVKKPKLALAIAGSYNKEQDTKAIQDKKLQLQVLKKSDGKGIATVDVLEDIYEESVGGKVLDALEKEFKKKYTKDDLFKIEYRKELLIRCTDIQVVSIDELKVLATSRATKLQEYLVLTKNVDSSRILLHKIQEAEDDKLIKTTLKIEVK